MKEYSNKELNRVDPLKKQEEVSAKDRGAGYSPLDPPGAYTPPSSIKVNYEDFHLLFKKFIDEHNQLKNEMNRFEELLKKLHRNFDLIIDLDDEVRNFYLYFNQEFSLHNKKEEKYLFPKLNQRFLEVGEHSKTKIPITPITVLEDEHILATRTAAQAEQTWFLLHEIFDKHAQKTLLVNFIEKSMELLEIVRLHIFREDDIVFSLAQKHLTEDELNQICQQMSL